MVFTGGKKSQVMIAGTGKAIFLLTVMAAFWLVFMVGLMKSYILEFHILATLGSTVTILTGRSWGYVNELIE